MFFMGKNKGNRGSKEIIGQNPYKSDGHYFSGEIREVPKTMKIGSPKGTKNRVKFN